jgi:hypothetical protein
MSDPVGAADKRSSETVAVPNSANTESVNLAWSRGNDVPDIQRMPVDDGRGVPAGPDVAREPTDDQSWTTAWTRAAALLLVCLALAAVIVVAGWVMHTDKASDQASAPPTPTAAPVPSSASAATTTVSSTPDQDSRYIAALNEKGIEFANPKDAVFNGKTVCQNLGLGMTVQQIVVQFQSSSPAFSVHADDFVAISVRAYCPQYSKLVAAI